MKKLFLLFLFSYFQSSSAQNNYWQQQLNYTIDVSLNDQEHTLEGFQKLEYTNNSPDTLFFIWFHIWPNAYRNDKTAFSYQRLRNGKTDFYFSDKEDKGFMNQLDFRSDNKTLLTEDHPVHIDIIKVYLNEPLVPGQSSVITTTFHVKIPYLFSRMGRVGQHYSITQWYPKPAVYDKEGWHPIPYLDYGEYYSEFAGYDVRITVPEQYKIAATGDLQDEKEKAWMLSEKAPVVKSHSPAVQKRKYKSPYNRKTSQPVQQIIVAESKTRDQKTKTIRFLQDKVHDFAWFASTDFEVDYDSVMLTSGKKIDVFVYRLPETTIWKEAKRFARDAIIFRSNEIADYPYNSISIVQGKTKTGGGMEYPGITIIDEVNDPKSLDFIIQHEIGHNWFYSAIASDERRFPWMDEGLNSFYDRRYLQQKYGSVNMLSFNHRKLPEDEMDFMVRWIERIHKDQPISTSSDSLTAFNYNVIPYLKAALWLGQLEKIMGPAAFNNGIRSYYRTWNTRHPYPSDLQRSFEEISGTDLGDHFKLLDVRGSDHLPEFKRSIKPAFIFNFRNTDSIHYISFAPLAGFNRYDKIMLGAVIHNYNLPPAGFRFLVAPLYATGSKRLNGSARLSHVWFGNGSVRKAEFSVDGNRYSTRMGLDSLDNKVFGEFYRISPSLKIILNEDISSTRIRTIGFRTFFTGEKGFAGFGQKTIDSIIFKTYVRSTDRSSYYINQLEYTEENYRTLYPYDYTLQFQQGNKFYRINLTANYFFNYAGGGGLNLRFFAGKFGYMGKGKFHRAELMRFQPKLMAVTGDEDFTYSNYFIARSSTYASEGAGTENAGFPAQQIMIRDGGMKMRMDYFGFLQGRSDNWVTAINLNSTLPNGILPFKTPVRLFADFGTYADAWTKNAENPRFTFIAGIQLSFLNDIVNVYAPVIYSKYIRDNLSTIPELNTFTKRLTFSIDIHRLSAARVMGNKLPLF